MSEFGLAQVGWIHKNYLFIYNKCNQLIIAQSQPNYYK